MWSFGRNQVRPRLKKAKHHVRFKRGWRSWRSVMSSRNVQRETESGHLSLFPPKLDRCLVLWLVTYDYWPREHVWSFSFLEVVRGWLFKNERYYPAVLNLGNGRQLVTSLVFNYVSFVHFVICRRNGGLYVDRDIDRDRGRTTQTERDEKVHWTR